jgi:hypothetical protein
MNTASNTRLRLTTQVGQDHAATGVLLALRTNNQPHRPENAADHKTRALLIYTGQAGEHHQSDQSLLVKPGNFHRTEQPLHRSGQCSTPVRPVQAKKPQNTKQAPSSKMTQTQNSSNMGQQRTHPNVHPRKTQQGSAPVRPVRGTGQTGVT